MGEIILVTDIPREEGMLYYCSSDENGMLTVGKAVMSRGGKKKKQSK